MASDRVARLVPEHRFRAVVEMNDALALVDRDDRVGGDGENAGELGFGGTKLGLDFPRARAVAT